MKTRKITIVALVLIAVGLITCIVCFGFGFRYDRDIESAIRESFSRTYPGDLENSQNNSIQNIKNLDFDLDSCTLNIVEGNDISLDVKDAIKDTITQKVDGDTLKVVQELPSKYKNHSNISIFGIDINRGNINSSKTVITLTVPKDYKFDNVDFKTDVVKLNISRLTSDVFKLDADVGSADISNLTSNKTYIKSDVASVNVNNSVINDATISTDVGSIDVNGVMTGDCKVSANVGGINLNLRGNVSDYSFTSNSGIGSVRINGKKPSELNNLNGKNTMKLDSDVGSVTININ